MLGPSPIVWRAIVLPPCDGGGVVRCPQDVHVAVAVYVGTIHAGRPIEIPRHRVLGPSPVAWRAIVLPPCDGVRIDRGAQDVQIAVTVHVRGIDTDRLSEVSVHGVLGPSPVAWRAIVLPPCDVVSDSRRAQDIQIAVTVDVGAIHARRSVKR